jgi:4-hydroxy-4-methyl-2-oxoglutarate aldolase
MSERPLTGKIARSRIRLLELPRPPQELVEGFLALTDLAGTVSDAMDEIGLDGAIPASVLVPQVAGRRIVGPALTVHNIRQAVPAHLGATQRLSKQADIEAHNLAMPGDVLVLKGAVGISSLGGNAVSIGHRQGEIGAVVDGSVRDIETARGLGYGVWSRGVSLITGKWRMETVEINGTVEIAGVPVAAGDLVVADENGVCFIPRDRAAEVLHRAQELSAGEEARARDVAAGLGVPEIANKRYFAPYRK